MALGDFDPVVLTFHSDNSIDKQLLYCVRPTAAAKYSLSIEPRRRGHNGGRAAPRNKGGGGGGGAKPPPQGRPRRQSTPPPPPRVFFCVSNARVEPPLCGNDS